MADFIALATACGCIVFPIGWQLRHPFRYNSNIKNMKTQFDKLEHVSSKVELMVDEARKDPQTFGLDVEGWIKECKETKASVYKILEEIERDEKRGCSAHCLNLRSRYILSRKAIKTTRKIVQVLREEYFDKIVETNPQWSKELLPQTVAVTPFVEDQLCRRFTIAEIRSTTKDFNHEFLVGKGGFGKVYKGLVNNGATTVAIKRLDPTSNQGGTEFSTEIEMLSKFRHCNLVSLIGNCDNGHEMILLYEYMRNGTMADHLHPKDGS